MRTSIRKLLLALVIVIGGVTLPPTIQKAQAGGQRWSAWAFQPDTNTVMLLVEPGTAGPVNSYILPVPVGMTRIQGSIAIAHNWNYMAYVASTEAGQRDLAIWSRDLNAALHVIPLPPQTATSLFSNQYDWQANENSFNDDSTSLAFGYAQSGGGWTINIYDIISGSNIAQLTSASAALTALHIVAADGWVPVVQRFSHGQIIFTLANGSTPLPTHYDSYNWDMTANTVTITGAYPMINVDTLQPTGETVAAALDTHFPANANPGALNVLLAYVPATSTSTRFFTTSAMPIIGAKFVQNGERVMYYGYDTLPSSHLGYTLLERSGVSLGTLADHTITDLIGWQDGVIYLAATPDGVTTLNLLNTRAGSIPTIAWTGTAGMQPIHFLETPGNMNLTGPFISWAGSGASPVTVVAPVTTAACLPTRLVIGGHGQVTPGSPNNIRTVPTTGAIIGAIPSGGVFSVLGGQTCASNGTLWWQVNYNGVIGYTAEGQSSTYFVAPYSGPPPVTATPMPAGSSFGIVGVTAAVTPESSANCPSTFNFSGQIVVNVPGQVMYRWERSDGATGPTMGITYPAGVTSVTVQTTWTLSGAFSGWERIHVLAPNDISSNQATFSLSCGAQPAAAVTHVTTSVSSPGGPTCPIVYNFSGTITTNGATTVTYKWERSDGASGPTQSINFGSGGTQSVSTSWTLGSHGFSYTGWERLHVLTPNNASSGQANFVLTCP